MFLCVLFFFKGAGTTIHLLSTPRASLSIWWSGAVGKETSQHRMAQCASVPVCCRDVLCCETAEELDPQFANIAAIMCDHSYLPTRFGGLVDNVQYIAGFVVRQVLRRLSALPTSFDVSNHLLVLKNNGGLIIPSDGTVKVVKAAERVISQLQSGQALKVSVILSEKRLACVFVLGNTHHRNTIWHWQPPFKPTEMRVSVFLKVSLHHIAKMASLRYQSGSTRKKLCWTVLFQGFNSHRPDSSWFVL